MKTLKTLILSIISLLAILSYSSCKKNDSNSSGTSQLNVSMTSTAEGTVGAPQTGSLGETTSPTPLHIDHLYLDIQRMSINTKEDAADSVDDESGWISLSTNANVYDLMSFRSGNDTLLASGTVTAAAIKQIRLVLGTNNSVVIGGVTYPLTVPSGMESGLKIMIDESLNTSITNLLMVFSPEASVKPTGSGTYILRPVIRVTKL
jgi:hypothetical protein